MIDISINIYCQALSIFFISFYEYNLFITRLRLNYKNIFVFLVSLCLRGKKYNNTTLF